MGSTLSPALDLAGVAQGQGSWPRAHGLVLQDFMDSQARALGPFTHRRSSWVPEWHSLAGPRTKWLFLGQALPQPHMALALLAQLPRSLLPPTPSGSTLS